MDKTKDPTTKLRECLQAAAESRRLGLNEPRRDFIRFAMYWRRMRRADRRNSPTTLPDR